MFIYANNRGWNSNRTKLTTTRGHCDHSKPFADLFWADWFVQRADQCYNTACSPFPHKDPSLHSAFLLTSPHAMSVVTILCSSLRHGLLLNSHFTQYLQPSIHSAPRFSYIPIPGTEASTPPGVIPFLFKKVSRWYWTGKSSEAIHSIILLVHVLFQVEKINEPQEEADKLLLFLLLLKSMWRKVCYD